MGRAPKLATRPEVAFRDGQQARESLPLPVVSYPGHYGTFFAFSSDDQPGRFYLCSCCQLAVANYLRLRPERPANAYAHRQAPLDSHDFPMALALHSANASDPREVLSFANGICHRCNLVRPSMDYCHPMYGGQFMRAYGWYVHQAFYRFGVEPRSRWTGTSDSLQYLGHETLEEVCPPKLRELIARDRECASEYRRESDRIMESVSGSPRRDITPDEVTYYRNVRVEEAQDYIRLRRAAAQSGRAVTTYVENVVRQEFGFRKVGEGWVSETLLAGLVRRLLPSHEVITHTRPAWLEGLELDMYVPGLLLGLEYQGQQHFHAVEAWGGEASLAELQERDARKLMLCKAAGVRLLHIDYTEPLTEDHIRSVLADYVSDGPA